MNLTYKNHKIKYLKFELINPNKIKYEGNSSFHILIFDKTTTEIQYPPNKNGKLEDHQIELINLYEDDRNISLS